MLKAADEGWADAMRKRRVVVTGGAGFLGAHTCAALLDAGAAVVCVDNLSSGSADNVRLLRDHPSGFELVVGDVVEGIEVTGAVDLVLHLACVASPPTYQRLPIETLRAGSEGTLNALRLASERKARFVISSTSEVYGDPEVSPQPETYRGNVNPVGPRSMYDEAKRFSEALTVACADTWGVSAGIVRIFNTYGPGMNPYDGRIVSTFARQALGNEAITVHGDGSQTRSLCHVSDTVRGILLMAASEHRGPINLGSPDERTVRELAELIRDLSGSSSRLAFGDAWPDDPKRRCPDISQARALLGWQPRVSLSEGLADTIDWYRTHP
jgi:dTDP-glucose 4,6-dehydratase